MDEAYLGIDYWFKVVEMLQQNWAVIEPADRGVMVKFISDRSPVFDEIPFGTEAEAVTALKRNGFRRYSAEPEAQRSIQHPKPPFRPGSHPNGRIYSSGRFWTS